MAVYHDRLLYHTPLYSVISHNAESFQCFVKFLHVFEHSTEMQTSNPYIPVHVTHMIVNGSNCVDQSLEYALNSAYRLANVSATRIGNITVASPYTYTERNIRKLLNILWFSYMVHCILKKQQQQKRNALSICNKWRQTRMTRQRKNVQGEDKRERERERDSILTDFKPNW